MTRLVKGVQATAIITTPAADAAARLIAIAIATIADVLVITVWLTVMQHDGGGGGGSNVRAHARAIVWSDDDCGPGTAETAKPITANNHTTTATTTVSSITVSTTISSNTISTVVVVVMNMPAVIYCRRRCRR